MLKVFSQKCCEAAWCEHEVILKFPIFQISHSLMNVIRCEPILAVMEFMLYGDLKT